MALTNIKKQALILRKRGLSYSAIKDKLGVSKSTLSYWLRDLPLSDERIKELQADNPRRIERFRNTMLAKRNSRLNQVYAQVSADIGELSKRELFIAGFFLYWAEGGKTKVYTTTLSNTDPRMVRFYLKWLGLLEVPEEKIKVRLQLYADMNIEQELKFWMNELRLPKKFFKKPYIKKSKTTDVKFRGFGHGTCNVILDNRDISEYVLQGLKYINSHFV